MCGIAGILHTDGQPVMRNELEPMVSAMAHRGPDGDGIRIDGNVAIGHRRLSIIDPEGGRQPMRNEDGSIWITYNGEIYNFVELRKELEGRGHRFRTRSDTETVIHAYEEWGDDCVNSFRGMFAFGIVDHRKRRIFLARDHFGIKPLCYYRDGTCFAFSSELQAFRRLGGVRLDMDLQAIDQYLWLQYIPAPRSVFRQIRKLPAASRMSITFDGKVQGPEEYWKILFRSDHRRKAADSMAELDAILRDSVKAHLVSDVPFGAFLSGGVDSSAIVAYMAQVMDRPVKTFSIGFEEKEYDESPFAETAAKRWGTDHHLEIVKPDALGILPSLVRICGEPFGDSSAIPTYHVSRLARRHVPMVLSGDGGDETFAGYHSYLQWMKYLHTPPPPDPRPCWKKLLRPLVGAVFPKRYPPRQKPGSRVEEWLRLINYLPENRRHALWRTEYRSVARLPLDVLEEAYRNAKQFDGVNRVQYMDFKSYLPNCILAKVDAASMLTSLEVRTPLMDRKVFEFAATLPESFNIRQFEGAGWEGKLLLKKVMEKYYPREYLHRPKRGFSIPFHKWFAKENALHAQIRERLTGSGSTLFDYFEMGTVTSLIDESNTGAVWLLLFLEEWFRQNKTSA